MRRNTPGPTILPHGCKLEFLTGCLSLSLSGQNYGGGMRPPPNSMGPGMPGMNMFVVCFNPSSAWVCVFLHPPSIC